MDRIEYLKFDVKPFEIFPSFTLFKLKNAHHLAFSCHEVAHTWNPNCSQAAFEVFTGAIGENIKIYGVFYLVSVIEFHSLQCIRLRLRFQTMLIKIAALLRRRSMKYFLFQFPQETLRSSLFLSTNCLLYCVGFCLHR